MVIIIEFCDIKQTMPPARQHVLTPSRMASTADITLQKARKVRPNKYVYEILPRLFLTCRAKAELLIVLEDVSVCKCEL